MMRKLLFVAFIAATLSGCVTVGEHTYTGDKAYEAAFEREKSQPVPKDEEVSLSSYELENLKPGERPKSETLEESLWYKMQRYERKLKTRGNLIKDEKLNAYIKELSCKLAAEYCKDIRTYVVRMPYFNATMSPNGALQVWSGLLLRVENEAQLAAVLGHEIGHYLRRHTLQRYESTRKARDAMAFFSLGFSAVGAPYANLGVSLATAGSLQAFSRDNEREADGYGLLLMSKAGYDPREAAKIWAYINAEVKADKKAKVPNVFSASHPRSEERDAVLQKLANKIVEQPVEMIQQPLPNGGILAKERFEEVIGPLRQRLLTDELALKKFDRANYLLGVLRERNANKAEIEFYQGELHRLKMDKEKEDLPKAIELYKKALVAPGEVPMEIYKSLGLAYSKSNQTEDAMHWLNIYLEKSPKAKDRKMIAHMIKELRK